MGNSADLQTCRQTVGNLQTAKLQTNIKLPKNNSVSILQLCTKQTLAAYSFSLLVAWLVVAFEILLLYGICDSDNLKKR